MSFAGEVKQEIIKNGNTAKHCRMAELSGMFALGAVWHETAALPYVEFVTENDGIAKKCFTIWKKSFKINVALTVRRYSGRNGKTEYVLSAFGRQTLGRLREALCLSEKTQGSLAELLRQPCCKKAWIRALFLMAGTMNDPVKSYHWEITLPNEAMADELRTCLSFFSVEAKLTKRKQLPVAYVKDGTQIADLLKVMEAHVALLQFENMRVYKEMRGNVNRQVNCEVGNLKKTVAAAKKQIQDIEYIRDTVGLDTLPEILRETARLRLEYPESSLQELGELLQPPMGRSGVNHRLQKLCDVAERLRS